MLVACVGPSAAERREQAVVTRRLMEAQAVHLPPEGRASCVGITTRLTEGGPAAERERRALAGRLSDDEVAAALRGARLDACPRRFEAARVARGLGPEPVVLVLGYGIDAAGRVCAVVEQTREALLDPAAAPLAEAAARCAKEALFAAQFPAGRVDGDARIVRLVRVPLSASASTAWAREAS